MWWSKGQGSLFGDAVKLDLNSSCLALNTVCTLLPWQSEDKCLLVVSS